MKTTPFKTSFADGQENVMDLDVNAKQIRFNRLTREISIVYEEIIELTEVVKKRKPKKKAKKVKP